MILTHKILIPNKIQILIVNRTLILHKTLIPSKTQILNKILILK